MELNGTLYQEQALREAARAANLRYVRDDVPGITRKASRRNGFIYFAPTNERITKDSVIERIHMLAIPPAYQDVWICPDANGHLQATGRDARKRKQYRYHPEWTQIRSETKFGQLAAFAQALPKIRRTLDTHLRKRTLCREKVLAAVVTLMDQCHIRVGNDTYAKENGTYGLTTLRKKHVELAGDTIRFSFKGKSGKQWECGLQSRPIARVVQHCEELPGQELFKYVDDAGELRDVTSDDVNRYIQEISGGPFTAKDFRTWAATAHAINLLGVLAPQDSARQTAMALNSTIKEIATAMGHTPAICRKSYIYPGVLDCFSEGALTAWYAKEQHRADHEMVQRFIKKW